MSYEDSNSMLMHFFGGAVIGLVVGFLGGIIMGVSGMTDDRHRAQAAGVGRYVANPETGQVTFEYGAAK